MSLLKIIVAAALCFQIASCTKKQEENSSAGSDPAMEASGATSNSTASEKANSENKEIMDTNGIHAPDGQAVSDPQTDQGKNTDCKADDEKCKGVKNSSEINKGH